MSSYERYDETSRYFDDTRGPVGSEVIFGCLARHERPLGDLEVLDAGCGTGAYSQAIVDRVGRVEALDFSRGMLAVAREKLRDAERRGRIRFHRGSITDLPFADASFDGVMINQVLHHLDDDADAGFPTHRRVIDEFARVLRPGGVLVINSCAQEQLREAYWYYRLIPVAATAQRALFAPLDAVRGILDDAGFGFRGTIVPVDATCQGEAYFDGRGPLDAAWRAGDSIWALASADEIERACARVRELDRAGVLDDFVAEHDSRRPMIGQIAFLSATRNAGSGP